MDCLFCKIIDQSIKSNIIYDDTEVLAFDDIHPQAPHHKLIIPKKHIATLNDLQPEDTHLLGHIIQVGKDLAKQLNFSDDGYRLVFNCKGHGGQEVYHLHLHLLGGRQMHWPPG